VPHLGLDLIEPGARYSAGQFARDASVWLAGVWAAGRQPVVVGGTGFYVRALAEGLFHEPPLDAAPRERLRAWAGRLGAAGLAHWAARLDRRFAGGGRQRAARVIEVALLTGRSLSWWQREARETGVMRPWYIHLTLPREALHRRIAQRVDRMLAAGLVEEVRGVLAGGVAPHAPGLDAVGYREVVAMLEGRLPESELRDAIERATRRYAKRQETWFRHQLRGEQGAGSGSIEVWTLDATEPPDVLAERIAAQWRERSAPRSPLPRPRS
jgi:tRNA dimethylallyltransferase